MSRIGLICFFGSGHLNPMLALGRELADRGHSVTVFHSATAAASVRAAGLEFCRIPNRPEPYGLMDGTCNSVRRALAMRHLLMALTTVTLRQLPRLLERYGIDGLVADQAELAAGTVSELMDIPFINVSNFPTLYLDKTVPPAYFSWQLGSGLLCRARNQMGNLAVEWCAVPSIRKINQERKGLGLRRVNSLNALFSAQAIISQLPAGLDFPRRESPKQLHHVGPLIRPDVRPKVKFDWLRVSSGPIIYASLGTVSNVTPTLFREIGMACSRLDVQLIMSLGGGRMAPSDLPSFPRHIVVHYAPQLEVLQRASLTVSHGGINTVLESLANGIPLLVIPLADDQPGMAARVQHAGVGEVLLARHATAEMLRVIISKLLSDDRYRRRAAELQMTIARSDSLSAAARVVESVLGITSQSVHGVGVNNV